MNIGAAIKARREELGLTQGYVAEAAGISQAMLCQIERGTKNPSLQIAIEIAKILNCNVQDFTDKEDKEVV